MENFKLSIDMLKLKNAVLTTSSRGTNLLVINLDDSEGFKIYKREENDDSVYLNLIARVNKDQSKNSHFLSPSGQFEQGYYPPACGYVQQFGDKQQNGSVNVTAKRNFSADIEEVTAEDLPF